MAQTIICNICEVEKPETDFYVNYKRCKKCHNKKRNFYYKKRPTGLDKLTNKDEFIEEIRKGVPPSRIYKKYGVSYKQAYRLKSKVLQLDGETQEVFSQMD